ncbi:hypothetical protein Gogos_011734 [Gossypium gossypioides]|uniref:Transposase MuDR plant domain-containing protein n=1 Tax=Gossypium gossypioides TaxID=34282 RepID=A0A7J9BQC5_GOSGO|nr:hypothetical protein [Gossypium gossypioides]
MLDFLVKFKEIDLYVVHEVDNPIIVDEMFLLTTGEGDVEGVEVDEEGDDEGVESNGESDLERVDEYGGVESGGQISLGSTVREDNDSEVVADEYASDFATSDRVDNVAACSGVQEDWMRLRYGTQMNMEAWLGLMKMKNMKMDEHHCSVSFKVKMVIAAMIAQHFEATIKDHPKMKLRRIQRISAFEMHVNVTIDCCYRAKKIVKEKTVGNHKEEFDLL